MKRDYFRQAEAALEVWHARTLKVRKFLEKNQIDKALEALRLKKAAYANFKAADGLLHHSDLGQALQKKWAEKAAQILALDAEIAQQITEICAQQENKIQEIRREKMAINRFRSTSDKPSGNLKNVVC